MTCSGSFARLYLVALALVLSTLASLASAQPSFPAPNSNPHAVATFQSIGLYWHGVGGAAQTAQVEFKKVGTTAWRRGLDLWFDSRNSEYRGSIVELEPSTTYDIRLTLQGTSTVATLQASTWSETFPVPAGFEIKLPPPPGGQTIARIVVNAANVPAPTSSLSGRELTISVPSSGTGYTLITADAGNQIVDPTGTPALGGAAFDNQVDSCILVNQGVQRVIIRGLELRNCRRHGVFMWRNLSSGAQTRDIVIEDNLVTGWGSFGKQVPDFPENDAAIGCVTPGVALNLRPIRIIAQRNILTNARHNATPWGPFGQPGVHPKGPQGFRLADCGRNHVIRYNDVVGVEGQKHFNDGIGGGPNFSNEGFPWADSDIHGNKITHVFDDAIEAEGGNRNVRIWGNYIDRALVAIANGATAVGPLYVWRNVSNDMALLRDPGDPDEGHNGRGPFVKAGANGEPIFNGGRAYYFHNTALQPPSQQSQPYPRGAGHGINDSAGSEPLYNFVSLNNIWHIHKVPHLGGSSDHWSIAADCEVRGPCTADHDLFNGRIENASNPGSPEVNGFGNPSVGDEASVPTYASSGGSYPASSALPSAANGWSGNFALAPSSLGFQGGVFLPNFNDLQNPDPGAHQSGAPAMRFGVAAAPDPGEPPGTAELTAIPTSGEAPLAVQFDSSHSFTTAVTYHIDFGDNTSSTLPNPAHTYQNAGQYTALLTVTETSTSRTATDSVTIDVSPQGGGGGGPTPSSFDLFVSAGPGLIISRIAGEQINFSVAAADHRALQQVRFFLDGAQRLSDTAAPFEFTWLPSASDPTGNYTLLVEVTDTAGNLAFESRTLTLLPDVCNIFVSAPSVTHGEPLHVQGVCSASQTVDSVDFFVDDVLQSPNRDATPAYTWTMDTSAFAPGTRALRVRALRSGASIGEHSVNVEIIAAPLTLSFSPGPVVSRTEGMTVTATATDGRALKQVDFYVNGEFRKAENAPPYVLSWPASGAAARPDRFGQQQLLVQATDMEGNVLTAKRDLYVLTQTCNVRVATSKHQAGSHDTVLVGPHTVVQGEPLVVQGLCSASQNVQQMQFDVSGVHRADGTAPYGVILSTGALSPGSHTLSITALLADGTTVTHAIPIEVLAPR